MRCKCQHTGAYNRHIAAISLIDTSHGDATNEVEPRSTFEVLLLLLSQTRFNIEIKNRQKFYLKAQDPVT